MKFLPLKKRAHRHFHADHPALQLENLDLVGESLLVGFEHSDYVLPVVFFADE